MELARRLKRPSWRDPRLGVGVVLVAASVALGGWAVSAAGQTEEVWAATGVLTPGEELAGHVALVEVSPALAERYLPAASRPEGTVDRVVGEGELVPRSAVVALEEVELRAVVVPAGAQLAGGVVEGATVDVWFNPAVRSGQAAAAQPPTLIAQDVVVKAVSNEDSVFAGADFGSVELLVEDWLLPGIMEAMAGEGSIHIVPGAAG